MAAPRGAPPRPALYASRLLRLPVLDAAGLTLGRVEDVLFGAPTATLGPPLVGLVVAIPERLALLPSRRLISIDAEHVRASELLRGRTFARRSDERLLVADLLDATLSDGREVNDVGLREQEHAPRWIVGTVHLRAPRTPARRRVLTAEGRGRSSQRARGLPWSQAAELFASGRPGEPDLRLMHAAHAADRVLAMAPRRRAAIVARLDDEQLADVMQELPEAVQSELLDGMGERAASVLERMDADDAVDLLGELESGRREELLGEMDTEGAADLRRLLAFAPDTAGGMMTPSPVVVAPDAAVADALAALRSVLVTPALASQVFVAEPPTCTPTGPLRGAVGLQRLLREPPARPIVECLEGPAQTVEPDAPADRVAEHLADFDLLVLGVVDATWRLVGAVTVDDVLQRYLPAPALHDQSAAAEYASKERST